MVIEKSTGKITGNRVMDEKGNVVMESENERVDVIKGVYVPVELKSVAKTNATGRELKMTTKMEYQNIKVNENILNKVFEVR